ncbi:HSP20 family molecular chaperone IbpA [Rhodoligotrophos appendicifer]|uniref:Hsp20 family protein n=1 Tax=Rhodoligotrophos appendicifer TaxID=987056 RepID=UPI0011800E6E|nr:Hsp20 family protein [Rhodoligotrophos appendicifer]
MSRVSLFSSPLLLGFDDIERLLDRLGKTASDGYPPYNIERLTADTDASQHLRITLAVAGFGRDELQVQVEENQLVVRGKQKDDGSRAYLHRGIAARQFLKTFVLADGIEVMGASLEHGMLAVDLVRRQQEKLVKTIDIREGRG